ncbi:hypothetical protein Mal52_11140 [Symmachiella dynata]|uniref:Uncharacterized protein n=1 Tax=Symmachiella dynata TaxID=2527995 RepID=A0A517ZJP3_9PLAN|nr:hypothetical protein Mal52_11140 [Symmachiella dynata]
MARPAKKRRFRSIVVDDVKYQWQFEGVLVVYSDSESSRRGQALVADWGWVDWLEPEYRDALPFDPHIVTPSFVRSAIQFAVTAGWQSHESGIPFRITYRQDQFELAPEAT